MIRAGIDEDVTRFLHVSTGGVYGSACEGEVPANESTPVNLTFQPDNFYDCAKLQAEEVVLDQHVKSRISVSVIRVPAVYGPRDRLLADRLYRHMSLPIIVWPGKSNPVYSITCAADVAEFALLAATNDKAAGQVYNVAPAEGMRFRDFAGMMIRAMGKPKPQVTVPYTLGYIWCALMENWAKARRVKDMPYLTRSGLRFLNRGMFIDGSRAKQELGWEPRISIEEGIDQYLNWRRAYNSK
jgi:nucleoside-diphosphate-sugar epimerase